ncbi:MAG: hypothetical protein JOY83_23595 [Alphaproteobacteria bacterium]|nr:hypothetical protein [Alphaproteobacteria bacterium]
MLRRFAVDQRGVVAVIMAFTLPVLIGFVGLGFDVGFWYFSRQNMQGAADAAAVSAAAALSAGDNAGYVTEAKAVAAQHGVVDGQNNVSVGVTFPYADVPYTTVCPTGNDYCLEVLITQTQAAMLSSVLGQGNVTIKARSVAQVSHQTYCMLALDQGNVTGIELTLFFSILNMPHCSIGSNATGSNSFELQGFLLELSAYTATLAGSFNNQCFLCFGPNPGNSFWQHPIKTNATSPFIPITDPYASRTIPTPASPLTIASISGTPPGNCQAVQSFNSGPHTLNATCYKGLTVSGSANVTFPTGGPYAIYGISVTGGTLTLNTANYTIVGQTGSSGISVSGGSVILSVGAGTTHIEGASGKPAINVTGGTVTTNGSASSRLDILGGSGQPAITVGSAGGGTLNLGDGNSNIQAAPGSGKSAITLAGNGAFTTADNTNSTGVVIGPSTPSTYAITVNTNSTACGFGFGSCSGHDLTLGAGTYTIMGGINVFTAGIGGGNVTLNPNGTSIGTYIIDGAGGTCGGNSNVGLCMTFGDLNGQNGTIVLTGGGPNNLAYAQTYSQGADGINLTAPQTGATAGLAVFQDRNATTCANTNCNLTVGVSFLTVTGALYYPAQALDFLGITVGNLQPANGNICLQLIAKTINITGLAYIDDQCPVGVSPIVGIGTGLAQLVE